MMVEVVESSLVLPSTETPKHGIWLSNIDFTVGVGHHTPMIYVYRPNCDKDFFRVETLKAALSEALVPFYPLAGRLDKGEDGRLEINCTGEGALFVVARSERSIDEFGDFAPSPEMRKLLVPMVPAVPPAILFTVQVTFFKSGEVILGTGYHHIAGDGFAAMHFIKAWSDMARGIQLTVPPFLDRNLLRARSPPTVCLDHIEYKLNAIEDEHNLSPANSPVTTAILKLTESQLILLKSTDHTSCSNGYKKEITTFQAVMAHVWRCACLARDLKHDQETRLYIAADIRARLKPPLPTGFFGNAICKSSAVAKAGEIVSNSIEFGAAKLRSAAARVDDEYVRSLIDFLEMRKKEVLQTLPKTDLAAISWLGMQTYDADFGWGRPKFVGRASIFCGGFVYLVRNPGDDGGFSIVISMETENIERFKKVFYKEFEANILDN